RWDAVAGPGVTGALDVVAVVSGAFDDSWITAVAALRVEVSEVSDVVTYSVNDTALVVRGKRPPASR
ncbi:hypothetical protein, partial [Saccharothrix sp. ST-888]|uniref:hypothetical protein n=1 Tax=Saccharothrix sp. ST-888 TaxID=1427391 RepID=UPI001E3AD88A